jgi:hypothetical protein
MKNTSIILLAFFCFTYAKAQTHYVPLSEYKFNGIYGQYRDDTTTVFSLVCNDWKNKTFDADSLTGVWMTEHPDASFRPVCSFSYYKNAKRRTFTYGWILDNDDNSKTLNAYLVSHGACPAKSMLWAASRKDMQPHSDVYNSPGVETKVFVDEATYKQFVQKLKK